MQLGRDIKLSRQTNFAEIKNNKWYEDFVAQDNRTKDIWVSKAIVWCEEPRRKKGMSVLGFCPNKDEWFYRMLAASLWALDRKKKMEQFK